MKRPKDSPSVIKTGLRHTGFFGSIIAVIVGASIIGGIVFVLYRFDVASLFYNRSQRSGSQSTLVGIEDLSELETLAYIRRTVFPHDYLSPDYDMTGLVRTIATAGGTAAEALSNEEYRHYRAANLAAELGLATRRQQGGYVVITAVYRFGYSVPELVNQIQGDTDSGPLGDLPEASLLSVGIEDIRRDSYPYGAVPLDAEGIRRVSTFISQEGLPDHIHKELALQSREGAIRILKRLTQNNW